MNETNVSQPVLDRLTAEWDDLTPEAQKAARYVLENPTEVGVSTVREIARAAQVNPNTVVRMARQAGFDGYDRRIEIFSREAVNAMAILAACRQDRLCAGKVRQYAAQQDQGRGGSA